MLVENPADPTTCDVGWDKKTAHDLRKQGFTQEQICVVLGMMCEHRETRYQIGYQLGFNDGAKNKISSGWSATMLHDWYFQLRRKFPTQTASHIWLLVTVQRQSKNPTLTRRLIEEHLFYCSERR